MATSQQQWRRGSQLLLLAAALALVLLIAAGSADAACPTGLTTCSGICYNLKSNPNHCGRCSNKCSSYPNTLHSCWNGKCNCRFRWGNCDHVRGCETNLNTNIQHCGRCNRVCSYRPGWRAYCDNGICRWCLVGWRYNFQLHRCVRNT